MTDPTPLDDAALDRLLDRYEAPTLSAGFADRVLAEAVRADRPATAPPLPPRVRAARRPWLRRGGWAGVIALNLIVASAIAATITGVAPRFAHVVAVAAHVLHIHRPETPPPHRAPPSTPRPVRSPGPAMPVARAAPFLRAPVLLPMHPPHLSRPPARAAFVGRPRRAAMHRPQGARHALRRSPSFARHGRASVVSRPRFGPQDGFRAHGFDRDRWGDDLRRPQERGWRDREEQGMRPWRQRGPDGWQGPGRGGRGARGMGWRRPFGRGRRF